MKPSNLALSTASSKATKTSSCNPEGERITLSFSKHCAAGNDFVIIEDPSWDPACHKSGARALCDRYFGIGADGIIWSPETGKMRIFNCDGSEAEMCGNGLRALASHLKFNGTIHTQAGPYQVRADGAVFFNQPRITRVDGYPLIDTGVPHLILEGLWDPLPLRIRYNANVTGLIQGKARTFERGVEGETRSCGTGAAALGFYYRLDEVTFASGERLTFEHQKEGLWLNGPSWLTFFGKWV